MDNTTKEKLQVIAKTLETDKGELKLFACIWRSDLKKWDILVSANWVNYQNLQENIGTIFDAFKSQFNGEYALRFSGIYPLSTKELIVENITKLFSATQGIIEINEVQIIGVRIEKMVVLISRPSEVPA